MNEYNKCLNMLRQCHHTHARTRAHIIDNSTDYYEIMKTDIYETDLIIFW